MRKPEDKAAAWSLAAVACVFGLLAAVIWWSSEGPRRACEDLGRSFGLPHVVHVQVGLYQDMCVCSDPSTGRVERFTTDLYIREVMEYGGDDE